MKRLRQSRVSISLGRRSSTLRSTICTARSRVRELFQGPGLLQTANEILLQYVLQVPERELRALFTKLGGHSPLLVLALILPIQGNGP